MNLFAGFFAAPTLADTTAPNTSSTTPATSAQTPAGTTVSTAPTSPTPPASFSGAGTLSPPPPATESLPLVPSLPGQESLPNPFAGLDGFDPFLQPEQMPSGPIAVTNPEPAPATIAPAPPATTPSPPTPSTQPEPLAPPVDEDKAVFLENADSAEETEDGKWVLVGNVRVRYRKYIVTSDRADIDMDAQTALFSGHVVMSAPTGEVVQGGETGTLKIDIANNTYTVANSETVIPASRFGIGLIEPLIIYGGVVSGRSTFIDARGVNFTTCDFVDPHYHFIATDMYIVPGTRLVAKHVSLYRRNKRLITWPYLVVPLDRRASTLNPQFGETADEGYFARFAIAYLLTSSLPGILHIDLLQKKGIGTGFDQSYGNPHNIKDGNGDVSLYNLPDRSLGRDTFSGAFNHHQQFGTINATMNTQFENDSYFLGNQTSQTLSQQLLFTRNVGNLNDSVSANISRSNYGGDITNTITSTFNQTYSPTMKERLTTQFNLSDYNSSFSGTSSGTAQLNSNVEYDETDRRFDWKLLANKFSTLSSSGGFGAASLGGLEKLPEFDLSTDPVRARLLQTLLPKTSQLSFSYGAYNEPASGMRGDRVNLGYDSGTDTFKVNNWQAFDFHGSFLQRFYSDNAAQYVLTNSDAYRLRIGKKSTASLRYDYLRPYGFTPFEFDFSGVTNLLSANLSYQETNAFQMNLSTGYDINAARQQNLFGPPQPWQNIAMQAVYKPTKYFLMQQSTSYDLNHGQFIDVTDNWSVRGRYGQALDVGARYAPQQQRIAAITETLDLPWVVDRRESSGWRLQTVAGYDGFTDSFNYTGAAVTRSWHDWEATLIYQNNPIGFQTGSTWTFNIRLKAFPGYQPFGVGNFGQSLSSGLGTVY